MRVVQQCMKMNLPLPNHLADIPYLQPELEWLISAFFELNTCRHPDGFIPWTATYMWARAHQISPENVPYFSGLISAMDKAYLEYRAEEMEKARKKGKGKGKAINQKGINTKEK